MFTTGIIMASLGLAYLYWRIHLLLKHREKRAEAKHWKRRKQERQALAAQYGIREEEVYQQAA